MTATAATPDDLAALARGGRTNVIGFLLRLAARLPFLFIAGRWYGAEMLGRFAYAILVIEFAAQLATLGLKRGLAAEIAKGHQPAAHCVWDALLVATLAAAAVAATLLVFPVAMFPNSALNGLDRLLPLTIFAIVWTEIALAALAYRFDIGATVRARAIVEPWTISIAAFALAFYSTRDGLIIAYVISMVAALLTAAWPLFASYGVPIGWRPRPLTLFMLARKNTPLAAADAIEWGSRRIDLAILGLFVSPAIVGVYWAAQQVASLPQKLKTSFDPILGPVITRNLAEGNRVGVARQVSQVGFWIIAAQAGVALALGIPGEAVMGLVGAAFVGGTGALAFLLAAEVVAATAAVSESALVYVARNRNMMISLAMLLVQIALSFVLIIAFRNAGLPPLYQAAGPAIALCLALGLGSILKARLLAHLLGARVNGWRWALVWAVAAATVTGTAATWLPEWAELAVGVPLVLGVYCWMIWTRGMGPDDRALFARRDGAVTGD